MKKDSLSMSRPWRARAANLDRVLRVLLNIGESATLRKRDTVGST